jgi:hypothetical protein
MKPILICGRKRWPKLGGICLAAKTPWATTLPWVPEFSAENLVPCTFPTHLSLPSTPVAEKQAPSNPYLHCQKHKLFQRMPLLRLMQWKLSRHEGRGTEQSSSSSLKVDSVPGSACSKDISPGCRISWYSWERELKVFKGKLKNVQLRWCIRKDYWYLLFTQKTRESQNQRTTTFFDFIAYLKLYVKCVIFLHPS